MPAEVKAEFIAPARRRRPADGRGDELRPARVGAAARGRRGGARPRCEPHEGRALPGARAERARARPRAGARRARRRRLRQRHRDVRAPQPQPQRSTRRSRCSRRSSRGPGTRGSRVRGYLSMCFGDPWEGARADRGRSWRAGRRLLDLGCDELSLGDTIGVGTPGQVAALLAAFGDAGVPRDAARRPLPRHLRPGARQHAGRAAVRRHDRGRRARAASAAARTRRAPPATSPPRTWCGCSTASASRPASTSAPWSPRSAWMAAAARPPEPVRASSARSPAHRNRRSHQ